MFHNYESTRDRELKLCMSKHLEKRVYQPTIYCTVTFTESGTPMLNWDSRYLCHFSTEMAEIWSPGTSFQDVWTCKISALYLLYFHSYETFSGNH